MTEERISSKPRATADTQRMLSSESRGSRPTSVSRSASPRLS